MTINADISGTLDVTFLAAQTAPRQIRMLVELRPAAWELAGLRDDVTPQRGTWTCWPSH